VIKAILFDCFGVLISDGLELVCRRLDQEDPEAREFIRHAVWLANTGQIESNEFIRSTAERVGVAPAEWRAQILQGEARDYQVFDLIQQLRLHYKTALLSNISKGSLAKRFTEKELAELFDSITTSSDVGYAKPSREIYLKAADQLGLPPEECVFIDDRREYAQAAEQVGMRWIHFKTYPQVVADLERLLGRKLSDAGIAGPDSSDPEN
jgi:HAD superfamily hydrolase (TIGR01549 family)